MRNLIDNQWFAIADFVLVLACGVVWMISPDYGIWFILITLFPWGLRIVSGRFPFKRTSLDWLIAIFLVTAWVGYWASYDKSTAWNKVWLLMTAVLLYYALVAQPKENWFTLCILFFCVGVGVSGYYFLTHDFHAAPRKLELVNHIGTWLMDIRPQTGWASIHPNYVAGIAAIMSPFIIYPALVSDKKINQRVILFYTFALMGLGIVFFALFMATSRGVVLAVISGLGVWLLWWLVNLNGIRQRVKIVAFFPSAVLIYLFVIIVFLYVGPANSGGIFPANYYYGDGSRVELLSRSLYLLWDYPFTGGGLGAFPGLYSQYLLNIPFFNVPNSHNVFLDVAIEVGLLGGVAFVLMYLASIWFVSHSLTQERSTEKKLLNWILLFSLIVAVIHGMVSDYLFNGNGTVLSLFLVALSMLVAQGDGFSRTVRYKLDRRLTGIRLLFIAITLAVFSKNILSVWYANQGSVLMSQVELDGFPNNGWAGPAIVSRLSDADTALQTSLQLDSDNRTANQRLGMLFMLRQDFESASEYLETAYKVAPGHRGVVKSLGYCYVWLGDLEKAGLFLSSIPEAQEELDVYIWWWSMQGRDDLSDNAILALQVFENKTNQP